MAHANKPLLIAPSRIPRLSGNVNRILIRASTGEYLGDEIITTLPVLRAADILFPRATKTVISGFPDVWRSTEKLKSIYVDPKKYRLETDEMTISEEYIAGIAASAAAEDMFDLAVVAPMEERVRPFQDLSARLAGRIGIEQYVELSFKGTSRADASLSIYKAWSEITAAAFGLPLSGISGVHPEYFVSTSDPIFSIVKDSLEQRGIFLGSFFVMNSFGTHNNISRETTIEMAKTLSIYGDIPVLVMNTYDCAFGLSWRSDDVIQPYSDGIFIANSIKMIPKMYKYFLYLSKGILSVDTGLAHLGHAVGKPVFSMFEDYLTPMKWHWAHGYRSETVSEPFFCDVDFANITGEKAEEIISKMMAWLDTTMQDLPG